MELISAHIENFGKLSNVEFNFNQGISVFERENGWGKSTLAAFIKVMLYGFEGEGKRDDLTNERKKYSPWQKGVYGGEIIFTNDDRKYRLSKVFGKKSAEDDCILSDPDTNIQITDIDASCVGKVFFHVDGPSYARSVYISQNDVLTVESTDDIFERIGGGAYASDEKIPYEKMTEQLKKKTDSMSPTRKTGALYKQREEIRSIENHLRDEESIELSLQRLSDMQDEYLKEKRSLTDRLGVLQKEQQTKSGYGEKLEQKKHYEELVSIYREKESVYNERLAGFGGKVPKKEAVDGIASKTNEFVQLSGNIDGMRSDPDSEEIEAVRELFPDGIPVSREDVSGRISAWNKHNELKSALGSKKTTLKMAKLTYANNKKKNVNIMLILAVVIMVIAAVTLIFVPVIGAILLALGVVLFIFKGRSDGNDSDGMPTEYDELQAEIEADEQTILDIEEQTRAFLSELGVEYREESIADDLYKIGTLIDKYDGVREREARFNNAKKRYDMLGDEILQDIRALGVKAGESLTGYDGIRSVVQDISSMAAGLWQSERDMNEARLRLERFEAEIGDVEAIADLEEPELDVSLEAIGEEIASITDSIEELTEKISQNSRQMDIYRDNYVDLQEERQRLEGLKEKQEEDEKRYKYLCMTRELLEKAKQNMALRYTGPVQRSLDHYLSMIMNEDEREDVVIDANMHITARELGQQREIDHLSHGYQDLVGICFRMAFADAMYPEERPTLIFDDPFVNFDDQKLERAKQLLQELGKRYQIIYFTCHKSRS